MRLNIEIYGQDWWEFISTLHYFKNYYNLVYKHFVGNFTNQFNFTCKNDHYYFIFKEIKICTDPNDISNNHFHKKVI